MKKLKLIEIRQALMDPRFRTLLPASLEKEVNEFLKNPNCACNMPFYKKVLSECRDALKEYFPDTEIQDIEIKYDNWIVINTDIHSLQKELGKLPSGPKQLEMSRWQDQVTVVVKLVD